MNTDPIKPDEFKTLDEWITDRLAEPQEAMTRTTLEDCRAEIERLRAERDLWKRRYGRLDPRPDVEAAERAAEGE